MSKVWFQKKKKPREREPTQSLPHHPLESTPVIQPNVKLRTPTAVAVANKKKVIIEANKKAHAYITKYGSLAHIKIVEDFKRRVSVAKDSVEFTKIWKDKLDIGSPLFLVAISDLNKAKLYLARVKKSGVAYPDDPPDHIPFPDYSFANPLYTSDLEETDYLDPGISRWSFLQGLIREETLDCKASIQTRLTRLVSGSFKDVLTSLTKKFGEAVLLFLADLYVASSWAAIALAVYRLAKIILPFDMFKKAFKSVEACTEMFNEFMSPVVTEGENSAVKELLDNLRDMRDTAIDFSGSPLFLRLMAFVESIMSTAALAGLKISKVVKFVVPKTLRASKFVDTNPASLFGTLMSSLFDLVDYGYQAYVEGFDISMVHTRATYTAWLKDAVDLFEQEHHVGRGQDKVLPDDYRKMVIDVHDRGKEMFDLVTIAAPSAIPHMTRMLERINKLHTQYVVNFGSGVRPQPFCILLAGPPGVGKTKLQNLLFNQFSCVTDCPIKFDNDDIFILNAQNKFWDRYKGNAWIGVDDISSTKAVKGVIPDDLALLIRMINNIPFDPPMAALEDKGMFPFAPQVVILTTNNTHLDIKTHFVAPAAINRRISMRIKMRVDPKFERHCNGIATGSVHTDTYNAEREVDPHALPWILTVETSELVACRPRDGKYDSETKWIVRAEGEFHAISHIIARIMVEHYDNQVVFLKGVALDRTIEFCQDCWKVTSRCICDGAVDAEVWLTEEDLNDPDYADLSLPDDLDKQLISINAHLASFDDKPPSKNKTWVMRQRFLVMQAMNDAEAFSPVTEGSLDIIVYTTLFGLLLANSHHMWGTWVKVLKRIFVVCQLLYRFDKIEIQGAVLEVAIADAGERVSIHLARAAGARLMYAQHALSAVAGGLFIYKTIEMLRRRPTTQGARLSTATYETTLRPDIYYNKGHIKQAVLSHCTKSSTYNEVLPLIERATYFVKIRHGGTKRVVKTVVCFNVCGQDFLFAGHNIPTTPGLELVIDFKLEDEPFGSGPICSVNVDDFSHYGDLALVRLTKRNAERDFTKFFLESRAGHGSNFGACLVTPTFTIPCPAVWYDNNITYEATSTGTKYTFPSGFIEYGSSQPKMCGSVLVQRTDCGGLAIVGFHVAGSERHNLGYSQPLSYQQVVDLRTEALSIVPQCEAVSLVDVYQGNIKWSIRQEPHYKNMVRYIPHGRARILGEYTGPYHPPKHDVRRTLMFSDVAEKFGPTIYVEPNMSVGWIGEGDDREFADPSRKALEQISQAEVVIDSKVLWAAVDSFTNRIMDGIPYRDIESLVPLTDYEAVNGVAGNPYIRGLNKTAGAGIPMGGKKKDLLVSAPKPDYPDGVFWNDEAFDEITRVQDLYRVGPFGPVYSGHLKSEPRTMLPNGKGKVARFFNNPGIGTVHLMRKYFLPIIALFQKHSRITECAVGVNATSLEWEHLYDMLLRYGDRRIIAGDYAHYDKDQSSDLILYSYYVMIFLMEHARAYTPEDIHICWGLAQDGAFPVVLFNRLLIKLYGSNPSGIPVTTMINGNGNSILFRVGWIMSGNDITDFDEQVSFMQYGDDYIASVSTTSSFTHHDMSDAMAKIGMVHTLPDKSSRRVDYLTIDEVDFLKRRFVKRQGRVYCPLAMTSVIRSLSYSSGTTLTVRDHSIEVLQTMTCEMYQYGREKFEDMRDFAVAMKKKYGLVFDLMTFDEYECQVAKAYETSYLYCNIYE